MKLPESGRLSPPLFPLSEYGSSAEMKLTFFTLTAAQPVSLRRARESDVPSISQEMIFSFPHFGWGKEVFGSL